MNTTPGSSEYENLSPEAVRAEIVELLCSACEIARREGRATNWPAFLRGAEATLAQIGRRAVTARTFRTHDDA